MAGFLPQSGINSENRYYFEIENFSIAWDDDRCLMQCFIIRRMFEVIKQDTGSRARTGILKTPHGQVETPSYVIVGTHAQVRELNATDLEKTKTQIVIANTYHLWQALGEAGLEKYAGLHKNMNWPKPIMTDSGGFQVFSLGFARELGGGKVSDGVSDMANSPEKNLVRITDEGVYFNVNDKEEYLDAEKSMQIQKHLGADIIFAFDEPTSPHHDHKYTAAALQRTHAWAERSLKARATHQLIYGIVQGGGFQDLRQESAKFIGSLDFDGLAIGGAYGSSFGGSTLLTINGPDHKTFQELDWTIPFLPQEKPRHMLGIGLVEDLFMGVEKGMDTFDCVIPTREGRHGSVYTVAGRIDIKRGIYREDKTVIDEACGCEVCAIKKISKQELGEMFRAKNQEAGYLASFHNVYFFNNLMAQIRHSIKEGRFGEFKNQYLSR